MNNKSIQDRINRAMPIESLAKSSERIDRLGALIKSKSDFQALIDEINAPPLPEEADLDESKKMSRWRIFRRYLAEDEYRKLISLKDEMGDDLNFDKIKAFLAECYENSVKVDAVGYSALQAIRNQESVDGLGVKIDGLKKFLEGKSIDDLKPYFAPKDFRILKDKWINKGEDQDLETVLLAHLAITEGQVAKNFVRAIRRADAMANFVYDKRYAPFERADYFPSAGEDNIDALFEKGDDKFEPVLLEARRLDSQMSRDSAFITEHLTRNPEDIDLIPERIRKNFSSFVERALQKREKQAREDGNTADLFDIIVESNRARDEYLGISGTDSGAEILGDDEFEQALLDGDLSRDIQSSNREKFLESVNRLESTQSKMEKLVNTEGFKKAYIEKFNKVYLTRYMTDVLMKARDRIKEVDDAINIGKARGDRRLIDDLEREKSLAKEVIALFGEKLNTDLGSECFRLLSLADYHNQLNNEFGIVETESVKRLKEKVKKLLFEDNNPLLEGHYGSGKTAIARVSALEYTFDSKMQYYRDIVDKMLSGRLSFRDLDEATRKELRRVYDPKRKAFNKEAVREISMPIVFSGSDQATVFDLIGKMKLKPNEGLGQLDKIKSELKDRGIELNDSELALALSGKATPETIFAKGPLARAIEEGRVLIMDEINMIPAEVLGRLNDILTKKVGDKIAIQENGQDEYLIRPGFGVIGTQNDNKDKRYTGTQEANAAQLSRYTRIDVDYTPIDETYDILISSVIDPNKFDLIEGVDSSVLAKLVELSVATRELQDIFKGSSDAQSFLDLADGSKSTAIPMEKMDSTVSTRDLIKKVIEPWKRGGFKEPIGNVVYERLVKPTKNIIDRRTMLEVFIRNGVIDDISVIENDDGLTTEQLQYIQNMYKTLVAEGDFDKAVYGNFADDEYRSIIKKAVQGLQSGLSFSPDNGWRI